MYTLDTNSVVYLLAGRGRVGERILSVPPAEVTVPAIVLYELEVGVAKSSAPGQARARLRALMEPLGILPFDAKVARVAARIRAGLEVSGTPIGPLDNLIAGTALANGATLVTHNTAEFRRVEGLGLEDWYD